MDVFLRNSFHVVSSFQDILSGMHKEIKKIVEGGIEDVRSYVGAGTVSSTFVSSTNFSVRYFMIAVTPIQAANTNAGIFKCSLVIFRHIFSNQSQSDLTNHEG